MPATDLALLSAVMDAATSPSLAAAAAQALMPRLLLLRVAPPPVLPARGACDAPLLPLLPMASRSVTHSASLPARSVLEWGQ